ncbi:hypothetical protein R3P38DRAFT_2799226 [Favolaschia claudopus]|uniref:Uncharacterized protein n=1 Tax=Favolaschia claudopus TaxID=2862362 RepID=A0AAW0A0D7_9AGAR
MGRGTVGRNLTERRCVFPVDGNADEGGMVCSSFPGVRGRRADAGARDGLPASRSKRILDPDALRCERAAVVRVWQLYRIENKKLDTGRLAGHHGPFISTPVSPQARLCEPLCHRVSHNTSDSKYPLFGVRRICFTPKPLSSPLSERIRAMMEGKSWGRLGTDSGLTKSGYAGIDKRRGGGGCRSSGRHLRNIRTSRGPAHMYTLCIDELSDQRYESIDEFGLLADMARHERPEDRGTMRGRFLGYTGRQCERAGATGHAKPGPSEWVG